MPLPKPTGQESQDKFLERCMSDDEIRKFPDSLGRLKICFRQWRAGQPQFKTKGSTMYENTARHNLRTYVIANCFSGDDEAYENAHELYDRRLAEQQPVSLVLNDKDDDQPPPPPRWMVSKRPQQDWNAIDRAQQREARINSELQGVPLPRKWMTRRDE